MYRAAICEDDVRTMEELQRLFGNILTRMGVEYELSSYSSAQQLWEALHSGKRFDILCLDIIMSGKNGMELAKTVRKHDDKVSILFITSSKEFLLQGYSVRPIQYLLKPVDALELEKALETDLRLHHKPQTVVLQIGTSTSVLNLTDILYLEGRDHGTYVEDAKGGQFYRLPLEQVEVKLPQDQFCRCHRSFVINLRCIQDVNKREITLTDGSTIPVSRTYLTDFRRQFNTYLNDVS